MKLNRDNVFDLILKSQAGFSAIWEEHLIYWGEESPGITEDFGVYADYVAKLVDQENNKEVELALSLIERFIIEGDENVQYGATIGFLEDVTSILLSGSKLHCQTFSSLLKPRANSFCKDLDNFWGTRTPGV